MTVVAHAPSRDRKPIDLGFWLVAGLIFVVLLVPKLFQLASARAGDLDTGNYSNYAWAIFHGEGFEGSLLGRHQLSEHFSPVMVLVGLIYLVWSSAYVLMILQATATAATIMLTLHLADRQFRAAGFDDDASGGRHASRIRAVGSALLVVLFFCYPPLLASWQTQFQPIELGMPLVVLTIILMHVERSARSDRWLAIVVVLLLTTRESAPLTVMGLAIYAALVLRRYGLTALLLLVAGLWASLSLGVLMPYFRAGAHWPHEKFFAPLAIWNLKWWYLLTVFMGLGVLPLIGRRAWAACAAAVPGILLNLVVNRTTQVTFVGHYDAQIAPFLMIAAAHGVVTLAVFARSGRRSAMAITVATAFGSIALASLFVQFAAPRTPVQLWSRWWPNHKRLEMVRKSKALARSFASAPALSGWSHIGPHVCHRRDYMAMRCGDSTESWIDWASDRLKPGTILLVPTSAYDDQDSAPERDLIAASGRAVLVKRDKLVEAWQWPTDAPPPATPEAEAYARARVEEAGNLSTTRPSAPSAENRKKRRK